MEAGVLGVVGVLARCARGVYAGTDVGCSGRCFGEGMGSNGVSFKWREGSGSAKSQLPSCGRWGRRRGLQAGDHIRMRRV